MARPLLCALLLCAACSDDTFVEVRDFGSNPGALRMFEHAPPEVATPAPLLVVLHGCAQDHGFAQTGGFTQLADQAGFVVLAPEQGLFNNGDLCFNWYDDADTLLDRGEAHSIKQMIDSVLDRYVIDDERIFLVGVSAGAAMASMLVVDYPELIDGAAIFAGGPAGCAHSVADSAACMTATMSTAVDDGDAWADRVRDLTDHAGPWPRILAIHGADDLVVNPKMTDALVAQWTTLHAVTRRAGATLDSSAGPIEVETFGDNREVESVRFSNVGHTMPVDIDGGCGAAAPFLDDLDFCTARHAAEFFAID